VDTAGKLIAGTLINMLKSVMYGKSVLFPMGMLRFKGTLFLKDMLRLK
jgi:hypothetical protein